jgi:hypothetical protein
MPTYIIHKDGVYNFYSSISDTCWFVSGITREQLEAVYKEEYGNSGMRDLPQRLERAHKKGTSCRLSPNLERFLICNRAGENESTLPFEEFVGRFLTIQGEEP